MNKTTFILRVIIVFLLVLGSAFFLFLILQENKNPITDIEPTSSEQLFPVKDIAPPSRTETDTTITPASSEPKVEPTQSTEEVKILLTDEQVTHLYDVSLPLSRDDDAHAYERELVDMSSYTIQYDDSDQTFIIALSGDNLPEARMASEARLANILGVQVVDLCRYNVIVTILPTLDRAYNPNIGLSSCPQ